MEAKRATDLIFIVSSASGVGKTTLCEMLRKKFAEIGESVSVTTRVARPKERNGVDYYFVQDEEFNKMAQRGEFVEYAEVYGHKYGTLKKEIDRIGAAGKVPLFDIDWQGARQMRLALQHKLVVSVYLLPPSVETVRQRLLARRSDDITIINERMKAFFQDISHAPEYDYVIVNDNLEDAFSKLSTIYKAAKLRDDTMMNTATRLRTLNSEKQQ